jgi:hypothetical protein
MCLGCGWDTSYPETGEATGVIEPSLPETNDDLAYLVDSSGKFVLDADGRYITFSATKNGYSFFDVTNQTSNLVSCLPNQRVQVVGLILTCSELCTATFTSGGNNIFKYNSGGAGHGLVISDEQDLWTGGYGETLAIAVSGLGAVSGRVTVRLKSW